MIAIAKPRSGSQPTFSFAAGDLLSLESLHKSTTECALLEPLFVHLLAQRTKELLVFVAHSWAREQSFDVFECDCPAFGAGRSKCVGDAYTETVFDAVITGSKAILQDLSSFKLEAFGELWPRERSACGEQKDRGKEQSKRFFHNVPLKRLGVGYTATSCGQFPFIVERYPKSAPPQKKKVWKR
tara:strand:- start:1515 stop:2066 length:552 start_codon:yes stop_codon:yes gene_type:complete